MHEPAKRPQSIGAVLDSGFQLYRARFGRLFGLMLIAGLAGVPLTLMQAPLGLQSLLHPGSGHLQSALFWAALAFAIKLLFEGAVIHGLATAARNSGSSLRDDMRAGLRGLPALFIAALGYGIAVGLGTLALVVPGIWLSCTLVFFPVPIMADRLGPLRALEASHDMVRGHWWRTATVLTVIAIIAASLYFAVFALVGSITGLEFSGFHLLGNPRALAQSVSPVMTYAALLNAVLNALLMPLGYAVAVAQYEDLRLRKSGDDLEDRISAALD